MAGAPQQGVSVPLSANVQKALEDLALVIAQARQAKAELSGLPQPTGAGSPSNHPLVARMPSAVIPGGKAATMRTPMVVGTQGAESPTQKAATERPMSSVYGHSEVMRGATNAAVKQAQPPGMPQSPVPPIHATGASAQGALQNQQDRLAQQLMNGPKMTAGGPKLGPLSMGALGGGLTGSFMKVLGPAAGYAAVAHIGLKSLESATSFMADAVAEAAEKGTDVNTVLARKAQSAAEELAFDLGRGVVSGLAPFSKMLINILGNSAQVGKEGGVLGAATRALLPLSNVLAFSDDPKLLAASAQGKIENLLDFLSGTQVAGLSSKQQRDKAADAAYDRAMAAINARAAQMAAKDSERVADQLVGLGFPGTFDQVKNNPHVMKAIDEISREDAHEERQRIEREYSRIRNAKME